MRVSGAARAGRAFTTIEFIAEIFKAKETKKPVDEQKQKIRALLSRYLRNHELGDDEDIFALGFVNSLFAMQLVMFVEKEFGVTIENDDLEIDNFRSINAIVDLVESKSVSHKGA
jgi:methoxymalonate biosynthesis acyl carrier protein